MDLPGFSYCVETPFETPSGDCFIAWVDQALVSLELPREWAHTPPRFEPFPRPLEEPDEHLPDFVKEAIRRVQAHLSGQVQSYDDLPVDLDDFPPFTREVLCVVRRIPAGETRSYEAVAREAGRPKAVRAVGQALRENPMPLIIPCHRVIASSGGLGGFSGPGGPESKRRLLALEGVVSPRPRVKCE